MWALHLLTQVFTKPQRLGCPRLGSSQPGLTSESTASTEGGRNTLDDHSQVWQGFQSVLWRRRSARSGRACVLGLEGLWKGSNENHIFIKLLLEVSFCSHPHCVRRGAGGTVILILQLNSNLWILPLQCSTSNTRGQQPSKSRESAKSPSSWGAARGGWGMSLTTGKV